MDTDTQLDDADECLRKAHLERIIGEANLDHAREIASEAAERFRQVTGQDVSNLLPTDANRGS
jgi:hypothetical protein